MLLKSTKDLEVYPTADRLAMEVFVASTSFSHDERYALTDQIRRSSRSVCANLHEAWARRHYEAHFVSRLTDADGENAETDTWLDFARDCGYLPKTEHKRLVDLCGQVDRMPGAMMSKPETFRPPASDLRPTL